METPAVIHSATVPTLSGCAYALPVKKTRNVVLGYNCGFSLCWLRLLGWSGGAAQGLARCTLYYSVDSREYVKLSFRRLL